jgi:CRP/FNR family cyclic AMP-dependent transcriptional regulator
METIESILAAHPFFKDLAPRHLKLLTECATEVSFPAGQYLFHENDEASWLYVLYQGRVAMEVFAGARGPLTIRTVEAGEVLGWLWFAKPYHWGFEARALEFTRALALDVGQVAQRCDGDHELGYTLLKAYSHLLAVHFRVTFLQLLDIYGT